MKLTRIHLLSLATTITLIILTSLWSARFVEASQLNLELSMASENYNMGGHITINGTVTLSGTPLVDGLVSIQINRPDGNLWLIRTLPTGINATTKQWPLQIIEVAPLPSNLIIKKDVLGLNITIKNNDLFDHNTLLVVSLLYEGVIPYKAKTIANLTMPANKTLRLMFSNVFTIEQDFPYGTYQVCVNMITDLPANGGFAWGLEGSTGIIVGYESSMYPPPPLMDGGFSLTFKTKDQYAMLGNYTLTASIRYVSMNPPFAGAARNSTVFEIVLIADITGPEGVPDGKVDIRDVTLVAYSFGSSPGDPGWNPIADLYPDNKINIRDVAVVAVDYGKIGILP